MFIRAFSYSFFFVPMHSFVCSKKMLPWQTIDLNPGLLSRQIKESTISILIDIFGDRSGSVVNPVGLSMEFSSYLGKAVVKNVWSLMKSYSLVNILRLSILRLMYLSPFGIIFMFTLNYHVSVSRNWLSFIPIISFRLTLMGHLIGQIIAC